MRGHKTSVIHALGEQAQPRPSKQDLQKRRILAAEDEQMAREGILLQVFLDQRGKSIEPFSHVVWPNARCTFTPAGMTIMMPSPS